MNVEIKTFCRKKKEMVRGFQFVGLYMNGEQVEYPELTGMEEMGLIKRFHEGTETGHDKWYLFVYDKTRYVQANPGDYIVIKHHKDGKDLRVLSSKQFEGFEEVTEESLFDGLDYEEYGGIETDKEAVENLLEEMEEKE